MRDGTDDRPWGFEAVYELATEERRAVQRALPGRAVTIEWKGGHTPFPLVWASALLAAPTGFALWMSQGRVAFHAFNSAWVGAATVLVLLLGAGFAVAWLLVSARNLQARTRLATVHASGAARGEFRFVANGDGFNRTTRGLAIEGARIDVSALWNSPSRGLVLVRGPDVTCLPRRIFETESDFARTLERLERLVPRNCIRLSAAP